ncbi:MAG: hypothetical protein Q8J78_13030 [Moraxellaceae bacterium]|nr:hypothetical protein [Moraxellaceae bacterium]
MRPTDVNAADPNADGVNSKGLSQADLNEAGMNDDDALTPSERELAGVLRHTLEQAAAQPDTTLDAALAATRAQVQDLRARPSRRPQAWMVAGGFALAASLAVVVVLPERQAPTTRGVSVVSLAAAPATAVDLQLLDDLDLLMAMGEPANGS